MTFCFLNDLTRAETSCCHSTEVQNQVEEAQLMSGFLPHLSNTKSPPQGNTANRALGRVPHLHLQSSSAIWASELTPTPAPPVPEAIDSLLSWRSTAEEVRPAVTAMHGQERRSQGHSTTAPAITNRFSCKNQSVLFCFLPAILRAHKMSK